MDPIKPAPRCGVTLTPGRGASWSQLIWTVMVTILVLTAPGQSGHAVTFACASGDSACVIQAITAANANDEADTLNLANGTYLFAQINHGTDGSNALPSITSRIDIVGSGAAFTHMEREPSAPPFRLFHVAASGRLQLDGITITGGDEAGNVLGGGGLLSHGEAVVLRSLVRENRAAMGGGGISISRDGSLTLTDSTVRDNRGACGGGIYNLGTVEVEHSRIAGNTADFGGGLCSQGELNLNESTVRGNTARIDGGGIWVSGATTRLTIGFLLENTAENSGGGFFLNGGDLSLQEVFVRRNMADADGGGGFVSQGVATLRLVFLTENTTGLRGGGLFVTAGTLTLRSYNIRANTAGLDGGGIFHESGTLDTQGGALGGNVPNNCNRTLCGLIP